MKRALIITILFSLLAGFSAGAKAPLAPKQPAKQEAAQMSSRLLCSNEAAELTSSTQFSLRAFKVRDQRFLVGLLRICCTEYQRPADTYGHANVYPPLPHLPLVRLLLFPKHYFW